MGGEYKMRLKYWHVLVAILAFLALIVVVSVSRTNKDVYGCEERTPSPEPVYVSLCREDSCVEVECDQDECESTCKIDDDCVEATPTATPSATPTATPEPARPTPAPKGPPEWEDPCFYLQGHEECMTKDEIFPGEGEVYGPNK